MSAVVAPSMNRYCLKCSEPSPTSEQGASYHWYRAFNAITYYDVLTLKICSKKCSTHCHFQESELHTDDSESSQEEIPAASPDPSKYTPKSSVDVDLSLFKNLSTILYRGLPGNPRPRLDPNASLLYCLSPGCEYRTKRSYDLDRHQRTHFPSQPGEKFDCPGRGCGRKGEHGFHRKDHLREHLRKVHAREIPKQGRRS